MLLGGADAMTCFKASLADNWLRMRYPEKSQKPLDDKALLVSKEKCQHFRLMLEWLCCLCAHHECMYSLAMRCWLHIDTHLPRRQSCGTHALLLSTLHSYRFLVSINRYTLLNLFWSNYSISMENGVSNRILQNLINCWITFTGFEARQGFASVRISDSWKLSSSGNCS